MVFLGLYMDLELFPVKFEVMVEKPLNNVREELNITPIKEGPTSWYQSPDLKNLGLS
jgi:ubiquinone biosynthesis protein COQ4